MSAKNAFDRVRHSPALKLVAGNILYGAYLGSTSLILTQCLSGLITLALNIHGETARRYEFLTHGILNLASGAIALNHASIAVAQDGFNNETSGKIGVALAFIGWSASQFMKLRMDLKNIETADKRYLDPANPCAVADIAAVGAFPPLIATNSLAVLKQFKEKLPQEDSPVSSWKEFRTKHFTSMRLLAGGLAAAGVAGAASGYGAAYMMAFGIWAWAYVGFEPKRNQAIIKDWISAKNKLA